MELHLEVNFSINLCVFDTHFFKFLRNIDPTGYK